MKLFIFLILFIPSSWSMSVENRIYGDAICGEWQLVKVTNQIDKTIYLMDGHISIIFNCELNTWQTLESKVVLGAGIWFLDEQTSQLQISVDGVSKLIPVLWVDEQTMILVMDDEHMEYKRVGF